MRIKNKKTTKGEVKELKQKIPAYFAACVLAAGILLNAANIPGISTVSTVSTVRASDLSDQSDQSENDDKIIVHMNTDGLTKPPDITAKSAVMINMHTGEPVYEKNSGMAVYPASTVKIMTAILVMEHISNLQEKTMISQYVFNNTPAGSRRINNPEVKVGEVFTIEELMYAMLLSGANDAALAMAEHVSGSVPEFVDLMNAKAKELGCTNTLFTNPSGLHDPSMYTTAADTAKIAAYASKIPEIMTMSTEGKFGINPTNKTPSDRTVSNRNSFVSKASDSKYYYQYARGINSGNTREAGHCLATVAEQKGLTYLCVVMGSTAIPRTDGEIPNSFADARSLFEWVFEIYSYKNIVSTSDKICTVEIRLSANRDTVTLVPDSDIELLLPQNVDKSEIITKWKPYDERLVAPIEVGAVLGEVLVLYKGEIKGRANLVSTANVEQSNVLFTIEQIKNITSRAWFRASVVIFIVLFAGYVVISLVRTNRREPKKFNW